MKTLLHIDSSPLGPEASISRRLTAEFIQGWLQANPGGQVIIRDLAKTELPRMSAEWIAAVHTPETLLTPQQKEILAVSNEFIAELQAADEYVIGVAMHNFSIPAVVKLWIDQIVRAGKTFSYDGSTPKGLLQGKKATFLMASGGTYDQGTQMASMNFVEPYLRSIFAFIGVVDTTFINAGGTIKLHFGGDRETIIKPAIDSIRSQFATAAV